jgi:cobalt-zinc-cadmium efflux system membrane fusion protein
MRDPTSPAVPGKLPGYRLRAVGVVHFGLAVLGGFLLALGGVLLPSSSLTAAEHKPAVSPEAPSLDVRLVPDKPHTLEIPDKVLTSLAIRAAAKKGKDQKVVSDLLATAEDPWNEAGKPDRKIKTRTLVLEGSTALDASRLRRIRAPFAPAEVVEIGQVSVNPNGDRQDPRELRAGDHVKEGQLLAVLSSAEVGLKKMELIDTVVLLKFDEKIRDLADKGGVPDVLILNYQRNVEVDQSNVARALNTLKAWNIPKKDIDDCLAVADEIIKRRGKREHKEADLARWARVELRAPIDGIIVERNVIQHEIIDDKTVNLFQIANVDRLLVIANCPEENLPALAAYAEELDKNQDNSTVGDSCAGLRAQG